MTFARKWFQNFRKEDRYLCIFVYLFLIGWCMPLLLQKNKFGVLDWDFFTAYFYIIRTTILDHGQFPLINLWMYKGTPIWGSPQIGPINYITPFVLLFGEEQGLRLGLLMGWLISFESARHLGKHLFKNPVAPVVAGFLYAFNTALMAQMGMGHFCFISYPFLPWLVLWSLRIKEHRNAGMAAGLLAGLMLQMGLHYFVIYSYFFVALLIAALVIKHSLWKQLIRFCSLFFIGFFLVCGSRLFSILSVMKDFPRKLFRAIDVPANLLFRMFFTPEVGHPKTWLKIEYKKNMIMDISSAEFLAYIGIFVLVLVLISLFRKWTFYHVGALLSFLFLLGSARLWHPTYWLAKIPPFSSMWMFSRWRIMFMACIAFLAALGYQSLYQSLETRGKKKLLWIPKLLLCGIILEYVLLLGPSWVKTQKFLPYKKTSRKQLKLPKTKGLITLKQYRSRYITTMPMYYPPFAANIGIKKGYDPLFGYDFARSRVLYLGHPAYRGEYVVKNKAVTPKSWSPNKVVFEKLPPGEILYLNIIPGKGWYLNGEELNPSYKNFELKRRFIVPIPSSGKVVLTYFPDGLGVGLKVTLVAFLCLLFWLYQENKYKKSAQQKA